MRKLISAIFGSPDTINKTIDTVSNGLDKLYYSDEEKAEAGAKDRAEARGMIVKWMDSTQGQNLSRRFLAFLISTTWALSYIVAMILNVVAIWATDPTNLQAAAQIISGGAERMNGAFMLVLGFYFALPHMDRIVGPAMDKFSKKN